MDVASVIIKKDGVETELPKATVLPSSGEIVKQVSDESVKKKRRRGKTKRKLLKPFSKIPWQRRKNDKTKRNNGFRKIVVRKTHAPYNNNQFLMEIHKPEPENDFQILQTPSARTRDSSFSVDSEENNYYYSLPPDEEEFLTKEFSSVYEDAQSERLTAMSKMELIQEFLMLESKYEKLLGNRNEDKNTSDTTATDGESMSTDRDTTGTSIDLSINEDPKLQEILQRLKEQEEQIREIKLENDQLRCENAHLRKQYHSSSADSESDSSSSSESSSSSRSASPKPQTVTECQPQNEPEVMENDGEVPLVNGYHNGSHNPLTDEGQVE